MRYLPNGVADGRVSRPFPRRSDAIPCAGGRWRADAAAAGPGCLKSEATGVGADDPRSLYFERTCFPWTGRIGPAIVWFGWDASVGSSDAVRHRRALARDRRAGPYQDRRASFRHERDRPARCGCGNAASDRLYKRSPCADYRAGRESAHPARPLRSSPRKLAVLLSPLRRRKGW